MDKVLAEFSGYLYDYKIGVLEQSPWDDYICRSCNRDLILDCPFLQTRKTVYDFPQQDRITCRDCFEEDAEGATNGTIVEIRRWFKKHPCQGACQAVHLTRSIQ